MMRGWAFDVDFTVSLTSMWTVMALCAVLIAMPFWRICRKSGYPGSLGLLILIPPLGLALIYWLAFADWPGSPETGAEKREA